MNKKFFSYSIPNYSFHLTNHLTWTFEVIRFDTPNIGWFFRHQYLHELCKACLKLGGCLETPRDQTFYCSNHINCCKHQIPTQITRLTDIKFVFKPCLQICIWLKNNSVTVHDIWTKSAAEKGLTPFFGGWIWLKYHTKLYIGFCFPWARLTTFKIKRKPIKKFVMRSKQLTTFYPILNDFPRVTKIIQKKNTNQNSYWASSGQCFQWQGLCHIVYIQFNFLQIILVLWRSAATYGVRSFLAEEFLFRETLWCDDVGRLAHCLGNKNKSTLKMYPKMFLFCSHFIS